MNREPSEKPPAADRPRKKKGRRASSRLAREVAAAERDPRRKLGRFVVLSRLGRGGMGVVHRAFDPSLRREVAVKVIGDARSRSAVERFHVEARAAARLRHPGIVSVHEVGEHRGRPYFVMDLVDGTTLEGAMAEGLDPRDVVALVRQVALALDHAHREGVVHRDVKPQNILVTRDGRALLTDFGLARDALSETRLTASGEVLGTVLYMPPEQIQGRIKAERAAAVDIWALGVVLYEALCGRPPFDGLLPVHVVAAVLSERPVPPSELAPEVDAALEGVILRCLRRSPAERYASAADLAADLERWLAGELAPPAAVSADGKGAMGSLVWMESDAEIVCPRCGRGVRDRCDRCGIDFRSGDGLTVGEAATLIIDVDDDDSDEFPAVTPATRPERAGGAERAPRRPAPFDLVVEGMLLPLTSPSALGLCALGAGIALLETAPSGPAAEPAVAGGVAASLLAGVAAVEHLRYAAIAPRNRGASLEDIRPFAPGRLARSLFFGLLAGLLLAALGLGAGLAEERPRAWLLGAAALSTPALCIAATLVTIVVSTRYTLATMLGPDVWADVARTMGASMLAIVSVVLAAGIGAATYVAWPPARVIEEASPLVRGPVAVIAATYAGAAAGLAARVVLESLGPEAFAGAPSRQWTRRRS